MDLLLLTKKPNVGSLTTSRLEGTNLVLMDHMKYLKFVYKPSGKLNVEERVKKATKSPYFCRKMLLKTWGLSLKLKHLGYSGHRNFTLRITCL